MGRMMFESKVMVAFDMRGVKAAVVSGGPRGGQIVAEAERPLPAGALVPGPFEDNVREPGAVCEALTSIRRELGTDLRRASLLLPEGVARLQLLQPPDGVPPLEFARFRLAQALPYAAGEALVDGLAAPPRGFLAAAVRRSVVRSYEAVAADAGLQQDRVELHAFVALEPLLRQPEQLGTQLVAVLGETAFSLCCFDAGRLVLVRQRRRDDDGGDQARLRDEITRTGIAAVGARVARVLAFGAGSSQLAAALRTDGFEAVSAAARATSHAVRVSGVAAS
jgi:Tfp pilus assembly PilM family ATPase